MLKQLLTKSSLIVSGSLIISVLAATGFPGQLASAQTAAPTAAATGQWCSGVKIVFFPGGTPGGSFESVVYNGAVQATADLGANTQYVWSDWQPDKMVTQFQAAMATKPDGIAVMGHPGDQAFKPLIDQAEQQGIIVTSQNTSLDQTEAAYKAVGFGYAGADLYPQGESVGNQAVSQFKLQKGDRVMVWGLLSQPGRGQRTKGVVDALKAAGATVDYLEIDSATNSSPSAGIPTFTGYVSAHPDVKAIIIDHGNLTASLPTFLKAAGKNPGDIKTAGFDLGAATVQGIKDGWIGFVNDQQEWLQGYLPILNICLTKKYGFSGLHVDTGAGFVTSANVDALAALAKQGIR